MLSFARVSRGRAILVLRPFRSLFSNATNTEKSSGPPPIEVAVTEAAGRGVFATRPISVGELIHTAKPLVTHPNPFLSHKVCYYCLRWLERDASPAENTSVCCFCSEKCREQSKGFCEVERKADWSLFDDYCRARGLKYPFVAKRLACMVISGAASPDSLHILQPATLVSEAVLQMEEEFELLKGAFIRAEIEEELMAFLTKQWYVNVLARIRVNAFRVELVAGSYSDLLASAVASIEAEAAVGNAVYILASFYNHDCDPNTHIIWIDSADARLKALRDIEAGEELRICYIDTSMDGEARRDILLRGFGFYCQCLRCSAGD